MQSGKQLDSFADSPEDFFDFVLEFFGQKNKDPLRRNQALLNFLYSIDSNKTTFPAAKLFAQFASGEFDNQAQQFFLFTRYLFEKEFKIRICEKGKGATKNPAQFLLTKLQAKDIMVAAFSSDDNDFLQNLLNRYAAVHKVNPDSFCLLTSK